MTPSIPMTSDEINQFFLILQNLNPHPTGELNYCDPFTLLVAVVLSAQATDKSVNKVTPALFQIADTPESVKPATTARIVAKATAEINPINKSPPSASLK